MEETVKVETVEDNIVHLKLNRPKKYNALNVAMFKTIREKAQEIAENHSNRVLIISGEGPGFCAGLDFEIFQSFESTAKEFDFFEKRQGEIFNYAQSMGYVWKDLKIPVIAALHGMASGGGLQIAMGADIRIAHNDSKLSAMEIQWGLIPDMSLSQTFRDLVPMDVAKELFLTGRAVGAEEALRLGLVTKISKDPVAEALELAKVIANKSPNAVRAAKQLIEQAWHGPSEEGLKLEESLQKGLLGRPNQREAMMANLQKRKPNFKDI